ncbi:MAG: SynChlorMet cassette protein ScmC [Proteobacteria bacterium]|nr:SynChlorMet cassette protein ScmC [Pseudomonadota bacterium]
MMESDSKYYGLTLCDGNSWCLTGDNEQTTWLNEFATILGLNSNNYNNNDKLLYYSNDCRNGLLLKEQKLEIHSLYTVDTDVGREPIDCQYIQIWSPEHAHYVLCELKCDVPNDYKYFNMWFSLQPIYQRSICSGGLPFHAALVELDGRGVLLAAIGGTGKSTCCRRLPDYWKPLCDDEALVVLDKKNRYVAHPFPTWSDYLMSRAENTWNVQEFVPICGVFFLEQSETDEVIPIGKGQAAVCMTEAATQVCCKFWAKIDNEARISYRRELFSNACKIANSVPAFTLKASLTGRFWEQIEKVL